jgi:hypothetical protein
MLAGHDRPMAPAALCCCFDASKRSAHAWIFMRYAVLSLLLACEPAQWFIEKWKLRAFFSQLELLKKLCGGLGSSLCLRGTGLEAIRAGAAVSLALPWLRLWRQWRRAEVTGAGGTGRKLVFWWRSCSQGRHAVGICEAERSEGGSPLSRDGALL